MCTFSPLNFARIKKSALRSNGDIQIADRQNVDKMPKNVFVYVLHLTPPDSPPSPQGLGALQSLGDN
jgi:hypothetical protein